MLRSFFLFSVSALWVGSVNAAGAQASLVETSSTCASERLSIYYARGEAALTTQALEVLAYIGREASRCNPDGIDIVTDIDISAEGGDGQAVALALARLHSVAKALISNGVAANRIRMAASPDADVMRPPMGEVGIMLQRNSAMPGHASAPQPSTPRQVPGSI